MLLANGTSLVITLPGVVDDHGDLYSVHVLDPPSFVSFNSETNEILVREPAFEDVGDYRFSIIVSELETYEMFETVYT